jgi:glyoxylase I family protein
VLEHGYCRSVYVTDPNEMIVEFTLDNPDADKVAPQRRLKARAELDRWLAGDHSSNNNYR